MCHRNTTEEYLHHYEPAAEHSESNDEDENETFEREGERVDEDGRSEPTVTPSDD